ncbi:hypothetical protein KPH14_011877 [Odynerus spinipes]|uniref:Retrotransposon gag domain-containing protein n=1 Tax=Odynerus spinipes TaxID=1348599 RepID=A0AAD9RCB2_9HYME|nr:hypothetical protein KPH14_011877 [Odynerus spinipes]
MSMSHSPQQQITNTRCEEANVTRNIDEEWLRLRREREEFEKLRAEFEHTRTSSIAANTRSKTRRNVDKGTESVSDNINEIERRAKKLISISGLGRGGVKEEHKRIVCESFLEGRVKIWADTVSSASQTYSEFKCKFLTEFYSIPIQVKLKNQWLSRQYRQHEGALQNYFYRQIRAARYLEPEMSIYEINYSIAQQFPIRIREALSAVDYANTSAMAQALAQLELLQKERETEGRRNHWEARNNQRHEVGNVRAMRYNSWKEPQQNFYSNRRFEVNRYGNRGHRAWRGPYNRSNYYDRDAE